MSDSQLTSLAKLDGYGRGVVRRLAGTRGTLGRLSALGFSLGADVRVLRNPRHGPLLVLVRETRVALARDVAHGILVQETSG